jgi:transposase
MAAAPWIVSDELWELIEPLSPKKKRRFRYPGRKRLPDRRKRGLRDGPSPVDRGRPGSKHHLLVDQSGLSLAFALTGSNRNDVTQLIPLLDAVPAVGGLVGRPRRRPDCVIADRGYDHDKYRRLLRQRGIEPVIARRQTEHGSGLGRYRWVVERTFAWLHNFKRLFVRYERPRRHAPRSARTRLLSRLLPAAQEFNLK